MINRKFVAIEETTLNCSCLIFKQLWPAVKLFKTNKYYDFLLRKLYISYLLFPEHKIFH